MFKSIKTIKSYNGLIRWNIHVHSKGLSNKWLLQYLILKPRTHMYNFSHVCAHTYKHSLPTSLALGVAETTPFLLMVRYRSRPLM